MNLLQASLLPLIILLSCGRGETADDVTDPAMPVLLLGEMVQGRLSPEGSQSFRLVLRADESVDLRVDQENVDLEIQILDPDHNVVGGFDGPYGTAAPEEMCFVANRSGTYEVRLRPFGRAGGEFQIFLARHGTATPSDRACAEALSLFMGAERKRLSGQSSAELAEAYVKIHRKLLEAGQTFIAAVSLRQSGIVWRSLGGSQQAERQYRSALALARKLDNVYLSVSLTTDLGQVYSDRHELSKASDEYARGLNLARRAGDRRLQATCLNNLALVDERSGRFHVALERLREAIELRSSHESDPEHIQIRINLARLYTLLDHHREALAMLEEALRESRRLGDSRLEASSLTSMGWVHHLNDQPKTGVPLLRQAHAIYIQRGDKRRALGVLDRLGTLHSAAGELRQARDAFESSLAISTQFDYGSEAAYTRINLACLFAKVGETDEASAQLARARSTIGDEQDFGSLSFMDYCAAKIERARGNLDGAIEAIERAGRHIEELRAIARQRGERLRPMPLWQDFSELQMHLLVDKAKQVSDERYEVQAFEAIEYARTRSFFEGVMVSKIGVVPVADTDLLERQAEVKEELNEIAGREVPADQRERRLNQLAFELERVRAAIRVADSRFARWAQTRPIEAEELRSLLADNQLILRYILSSERSYLFALAKDHWRLWYLPRKEELEPQILRFRESLRRSALDGEAWQLPARYLSRELLPPGVVPDGTSELLVIADGALHYLPLATLESPLSHRDHQARSLIDDDLRVTYLPSAALLRVAEEALPQSTEPSVSVAVFADPVFAIDDSRFGESSAPACRSILRDRELGSQETAGRELTRLPCTSAEARRILSFVDSESRFAALGFDANKNSVLESQLSEFKILHFATHAFVDERFPELSHLALSSYDRSARPIDDKLYLHEIYGMRLTADLVTLSGCQTALGRRVRGDGLQSLAQGFLYAGSSRVLVSLWSVDDAATAALMSKFYEGMLQEHLAPAAALEQAQRWVRDQDGWSAPVYWAPFVLQGKP